jgi:septal ring factor EnvC (AmiA/AmiB activator)
MFYKFLVLFLSGWLTLFLQSELWGQNDIERHHERLRRIRDEIRAFERKIKLSKKKESSLLNLLANYDLEIDLIHSLIQRSKKEEKNKERQIAKLEKKLKTSQAELEKLKEYFSKRLVYFYKYGRVKDLELLLTARSFNQGLLWIEYQKRVSEHDYRQYLKIKDKQAQIIRDRDLLTFELAEKRKIIQIKKEEEKNLTQQKAKRQKLLQSVRQDIEFLRQQLAEKEKAEAEIRRIILKLEQTPSQTVLVKPDRPFRELKGQMLWPTRGKIIKKFGRYVHPVLKTVTENIGIDIKAPAGSPVYVVARGRVTAITWQRGRGNIIIVSHFGGYYTVYTHLQEIWVGLEQEVEMGQTIGTVGESGSLEGPVLHFEIWKGSEKLNPEAWLGG